MTATDIEKKLNDEFGLYEIMKLSYNELTKDLYIYILINFEDEIIKNHNPKLIKALEDIASFDLCLFDDIPLEKFPKYKLEIINQDGVFSVTPDYIPTSKIQAYVFSSLESFFEKLFKSWKVI